MNGTMRIMSVMGIVGLLVGIGVVSRSNPVEAAGVVVSINAPAEVVKGSSFTVSVDVSSVTAFDAGQFDVSFSESVVQLDSVTGGLIGATKIPVDLWNKMGTGTYRIIVNVPGVPGVSGSGSLATLQFHATSSAVGSSTIGLSNVFLNNNLGTEIAATWTGDSISVCENLVITTTSIPDSKVGSAYSATLGATGGNSSYTWSVSSGSLPGGLILSAKGTISGTPTTAGDFAFTLKVSDGQLSDTKALSIKVTSISGDANGDGVINAADITKVERIIVGLEGATAGADANVDGKVNSADITKLERITVGLS